MQIDTTTDFGKRVERRLREETIIWLTTVRRDGTPQPTPVWFLWDGENVLIYSRPNQQKQRNIEHSPKVSLHFDGDGRGGDIIVLTGESRGARRGRPARPMSRHTSKNMPNQSNISAWTPHRSSPPTPSPFTSHRRTCAATDRATVFRVVAGFSLPFLAVAG
ncbi:MAG: TIGR03667 family PPOX class F420-dependent oxidoreductase [Thermomicrobia bacterium]|nr:TIGR03667 family PPOX class F420-dependent oxidoreductase [Thermomicrobia bacterium]